MSTPDTSRPSGTLEFLCSAPDFIAWLNSPESREKHRDQYNDLEWASQQPKGAPKYKVGDVVEFHAGGYGVIREVAQPHSGWPSSYATKDVEGYPPHAARKFAWHYEGDFKTWVAKSPLHSLPNAEAQRPQQGTLPPLVRPHGCDGIECQHDDVCGQRCPDSSLECTLPPNHHGDHIACGEHPNHNIKRWAQE